MNLYTLYAAALEKQATVGTNTATRMARPPAALVPGKIPQPTQGSVAGPAVGFKPKKSAQAPK